MKRPPFIHPQQQSKIGPTSINPGIAKSAEPTRTVGGGEDRTFIDTFLTKVPVTGQPTDVIYNGDRMWARVTLQLETAGPVAVGNMSNLDPVLSGKGQLLETGIPVTFTIAKGSRIYVSATGVNRVKRTVEPVPWLELITGLLQAMAGGAKSLLPGIHKST